MLRVEDLRRERENPSAAYLQFLLNSPKSPIGIHAFVEGRDDLSFYTNFIRAFAPDPNDVYPLYVCGDKEGVYKVHSLVKKGSSQGKTLFFVDKDLSDILGEIWEQDSNIYVTDYYSIESYLISKDMLFRIWSELFHFSRVTISLSEAYLNKFFTELGRFYQFVLPISAWGIYQRRMGMRPNMKNIHFSDFFVFTEDLTLEKSNQAKQIGESKLLERKCNIHINSDWQLEINTIIDDLSALIPKTYIYGKLELSFFVHFIEELINHLNRSVLPLDINARVWTDIQLHERNAIEVLGPRALIPSSLKRFLQENMQG